LQARRSQGRRQDRRAQQGLLGEVPDHRDLEEHVNATPHPAPRPAIRVAVVMDRERAPNRWQDWRFTIAEVVADEDAFGSEPRILRDDGKVRRTLHPGFTLELHADQGDGYYLNLSSGAPVWFVV